MQIDKEQLCCDSIRSLSKADLVLIAGSPLAVQIISNRLRLNNINALSKDQYRVLVLQITDWLDTNLNEPYMACYDTNNISPIVIGFPSAASMLHFKLRFDGWVS